MAITSATELSIPPTVLCRGIDADGPFLHIAYDPFYAELIRERDSYVWCFKRIDRSYERLPIPFVNWYRCVVYMVYRPLERSTAGATADAT